MNIHSIRSKFSVLAFVSALTSFAGVPASAAPINLVDTPLFLTTAAPPLNMLVLGRDHKLFYEAYNDHSDLNDDNVLDLDYDPTLVPTPGNPTVLMYKIAYYGYFDNFKCYTYSAANLRFEPASTTSNKKCTGATEWSGDWLNYMTMSRMDALRKVLYGGYRSTDTTETVLERAYIPQDAHSWGKSYESVAVNKYDLQDYTPLPLPAANSSTLFASTTKSTAPEPLLRILQNQQYGGATPLKVWHWLSIERPVAGNDVVTGVNSGGGEVRTNISSLITDMVVRVKVCATASTTELNCRKYTSGSTDSYKPIGLLQEYGEDDRMKFGLLSGSYKNNLDGGVLRKAVTSFKNEVDLTNGRFTAVSGIVATLNNLKIAGFKPDPDFSHDCSNGSAWITDKPLPNGECQNWGNPIAEMMYEGLRYFAGKTSPTAGFGTNANDGLENGLNLPVATWNATTDPYKASGANPNPWCAKPFETVISDINPSYDSDKVPGTSFGSYSGDLTGLNVSTLGQTIWNREFNSGSAITKSIFIGEVAGSSVVGPKSSAPTPKDATSFGTIRGLAPEEPTKQGSYYSASVAYYGATSDINTGSDAINNQNVATFAVALASPLPRIEIPVNGKKITLIPFAKSVDQYGINRTGSFQPTNQIVDFYVEYLDSTTGTGKFRVNFEDVEQGADHDMDAVALYEYSVNAGTGVVTVKMTSEYAAGGIYQHMGYIISGTTNDGIYLEVRDTDTAAASDVDYELDTPPGVSPGGAYNDAVALPLTATRTFNAGTTAGAELLKDPLWYAAKWGGYIDANKDGLPNPLSEWDSNLDDDPDNYFLVSNALTLGPRMADAFNEILKRTASASSASVNSGSINSESRVYQATFDSGKWIGHLHSFVVNPDGSLPTQTNPDGSVTPKAEWDAADQMPAWADRKIFTRNSANSAAIAFDWTNVGADTGLLNLLDPTSGNPEARKLLEYLRGDNKDEASQSNGIYRIRDNKLGDIINSAPIYVGRPAFRYRDNLETLAYSAFAYAQRDRPGVIYVGANDGMLHAFDATIPASGPVPKGKELFAYIPHAVFPNLASLASPNYSHKYFVDGSPSMGDAFFQVTGEPAAKWRTVLVGGLNKGGQSIYALDITDPTTFGASKVLWEFKDNDLGYTFSQPSIVRMANGDWAAVFGNGYNNSAADGTAGDGKAYLYFVRLSDGFLIKKILAGTSATSYGEPTNPNGLATPAVIDNNGDSIADFVYAGDLFGNLWKFDVRSTTPVKADQNDGWKSGHYTTGGSPRPFFVAQDGNATPIRQPITVRPEVIRGPGGTGMAILFGTGKYLENSDKVIAAAAPFPTQSLYALFDLNNCTLGSNCASTDRVTSRSTQLTQQTITQHVTVAHPAVGTLTSRTVRLTSNNSPIANAKGWYMDLVSPSPIGYQAERVVAKPLVRDGRVIFTTMSPKSDSCDYGGIGWIMELAPLTGTRLPSSPIDVNRDGVISGADLVNDGSANVAVSGFQSEVGITTAPGIMSAPANKDVAEEYKYSAGTSGLIQTTVESTDPDKKGRQSWTPLR